MNKNFTQGKNHGKEHPLVLALDLKKKALQNKANHKILRNIEKRIEIESHRTLDLLGGNTSLIDKMHVELDRTYTKP